MHICWVPRKLLSMNLPQFRSTHRVLACPIPVLHVRQSRIKVRHAHQQGGVWQHKKSEAGWNEALHRWRLLIPYPFCFKSEMHFFCLVGVFFCWFGFILFLKKMEYRLYCDTVFLRKMPCQFNLNLLLGLLFWILRMWLHWVSLWNFWTCRLVSNTFCSQSEVWKI